MKYYIKNVLQVTNNAKLAQLYISTFSVSPTHSFPSTYLRGSTSVGDNDVKLLTIDDTQVDTMHVDMHFDLSPGMVRYSLNTSHSVHP